MTLYNMLECVEKTLDEVTVKGKYNHELLLGAMNAIEQMKVIVSSMPNGGDKDGRQTDKQS